MEEFEKWWKKNGGGICDYKACKLIWQTALQWVLRNLEEQYEHTARGDTGWQGKFIEKELEKL